MQVPPQAPLTQETAAATAPAAVPPQDPDAALLVRLRAGDETAFAQIVARWSPAMLRLARSFVHTRQAAEDVVQDAWLGLIAGLDRFEGRSTLRTWAFSILVNRARSQGAREARLVSWSQLGEEDRGPSVEADRFQGADGQDPRHWTSVGAPLRWSGDPERRAMDAEIRGLIDSALEQLPPRQRVTVTLRDIVGMEAEETCRLLGVSAQNQRVLLHRGRAALRAALEGYYGS